MASTSEIAKRYFKAAADRDVEGMVACWAPGGLERFVGQQELTAPEGVREYFTGLFAAFPDFQFEVIELTSARTRAAVRWRAAGTFAGPGTFQGFSPNCVRIEIEGCDVLTRSEEHTSELQSPDHLVCRLLLEKKKQPHVSTPLPAAPYCGAPTSR